MKDKLVQSLQILLGKLSTLHLIAVLDLTREVEIIFSQLVLQYVDNNGDMQALLNLAYVLATGRKSRVELGVTENVQTGQEHRLDRLFEIVVREGERSVEALVQEEAELHSKYVPVEVRHLSLEIYLFSFLTTFISLIHFRSIMY